MRNLERRLQKLEAVQTSRPRDPQIQKKVDELTDAVICGRIDKETYDAEMKKWNPYIEEDKARSRHLLKLLEPINRILDEKMREMSCET